MNLQCTCITRQIPFFTCVPRNPNTPTARTILTVTQPEMSTTLDIYSIVIPVPTATFKLFSACCVICVSSPETFQWIKYFSKNNTKNHDQKEYYVGNKPFV